MRTQPSVSLKREKEIIDLALDILSLPTAPFREDAVMKKLAAILSKNKVPFCFDAYGNLVLGFGTIQKYEKFLRSKTQSPIPFMIAHTDHPGFVLDSKIDETTYKIRWLGGTPIEGLEGQKVWVAKDGKERLLGSIKSVEKNPHRAMLLSGVIVLDEPLPTDKKSSSSQKLHEWYGAFKFKKDAWIEEGILFSRVCDDLIGAVAIVQAAIGLRWNNKPLFVGLLSRAEEVGFIGSIAHFEKYKPTRNSIFVVSLETSRALPPTASIGKGPVVRLGDRMSIFDSSLTESLQQLATKTLGAGNFQRRIMDGGACEASASIAYGLPSIGLSVPLGNYHNQHFEGDHLPLSLDPSVKPGAKPELVSISDLLALCKIITAIAKSRNFCKDPFVQRRKEFKDSVKKYQSVWKKISLESKT